MIVEYPNGKTVTFKYTDDLRLAEIYFYRANKLWVRFVNVGSTPLWFWTDGCQVMGALDWNKRSDKTGHPVGKVIVDADRKRIKELEDENRKLKQQLEDQNARLASK